MAGEKITVQLGDLTLSLTLQEAEQLKKNLAAMIEKHIFSNKNIEPIKVTQDGYITRAAMYTFFGQFYPTEAKLRTHAGGLYNALVWNVPHGRIRLRCVNCGTADKWEPPCGADDHSKLMSIHTADLNSITAKEFLAIRNVGQQRLQDLELVKAHLQ